MVCVTHKSSVFLDKYAEKLNDVSTLLTQSLFHVSSLLNCSSKLNNQFHQADELNN